MKKKFRDISINNISYEWQFNSVIRIRKKNNNSICLLVDVGWYDVWGYITDLVKPEGTPGLKITPEFIRKSVLFALENGWNMEHKKLEIKYIDKIFYVNTPNGTHNQPDLEAKIYYLTEQEGGRKSFVASGYRGQFYYNGRDWDAPQLFINKEICNPGETVQTVLQTIHPHFHWKKFYIGKTFQIREGVRTVGLGKVTKILNPDFEIPDFKETIISAIKDFENENLSPDTFIQYLVRTDRYKQISRHFFNTSRDVLNLFSEMEKEGILTHLSEAEYKRNNKHAE